MSHQYRYGVQFPEPLLARYLRARPDDPAVHCNLACLHGCRGDAWRAVGKLATWWRTTPEKPGARRAQVDADSDFDLVRDDPWFTAFLARNTEAH